MTVTARELAAVRDQVTTAAAYREVKLTVTLRDALVELEIPDQVDRFGIAHVVIQPPFARQVFEDQGRQTELISGASRVNDDVAVHIVGPYQPVFVPSVGA